VPGKRKKTNKSSKKKTRAKLSGAEQRAMESIRKLRQGYHPKTTKTGTKFKGKNKVIIA